MTSCGRVAATVAVAFILGACRHMPSGVVPIDRDLTTHVPSDAVMLAGARLEALRSTATYARLSKQAESLPQFDDFSRQTGLDPRRDLTELLAASNDKDWIVIGRGRFNPAVLEDRAVRSGAHRMAHGKHTLIGREDGAVVFVGSSTALAGKPAMLHAALDHRSGIPAALQEKLKTVHVDSQLWFISVTTINPAGLYRGPSSGAVNPENFGRILNSVESLTASADLRNGIALRASGVCATERDAKQIHDALRGLLGLGRLSAPQNEPDLLRFYDSVMIAKEDRTVRFSAQAPLDLVDKLPLIGGGIGSSASPGLPRRD